MIPWNTWCRDWKQKIHPSIRPLGIARWCFRGSDWYLGRSPAMVSRKFPNLWQSWGIACSCATTYRRKLGQRCPLLRDEFWSVCRDSRVCRERAELKSVACCKARESNLGRPEFLIPPFLSFMLVGWILGVLGETPKPRKTLLTPIKTYLKMIWSGIPSLCGQTSNFHQFSMRVQPLWAGPFLQSQVQTHGYNPVYVGMLQLFAWSRRNVNLEHQIGKIESFSNSRIIFQTFPDLHVLGFHLVSRFHAKFRLSEALMAMIMFLFAVAITEATTVHVVHQGSIDGSMDRWIGHRVTLWKFEDWDVWDVWDVGVGMFWKLWISCGKFLGMMKPDESISSLPRKWDELGIYFWSLDAAGTGDTGDTTKLMRYWSSILGWSRLEQWI